jgi:YD repeat-containing protein
MIAETVTNAYDPLGRLTQVTDPLGFITHFSYDGIGNCTGTVVANAPGGLQPKNIFGCTDSRGYDELNRVVAVRDAKNGVTQTTIRRVTKDSIGLVEKIFLCSVCAAGIDRYVWPISGLNLWEPVRS